eukprot:9439428-Ditylum_brightwellii.AAC.1
MHHERHHILEKRHAGKQKKKCCDYHGLCHHDMEECNFVQARWKHSQPMHHIMEQQKLQQVQFVKHANRQAKKRSLSAKEIKHLYVFVKDKINETIKECNRNMHMMSSFEDLSISLSNKSVQSIISNTDNKRCKTAYKK